MVMIIPLKTVLVQLLLVNCFAVPSDGQRDLADQNGGRDSVYGLTRLRQGVNQLRQRFMSRGATTSSMRDDAAFADINFSPLTTGMRQQQTSQPLPIRDSFSGSIRNHGNLFMGDAGLQQRREADQRLHSYLSYRSSLTSQSQSEQSARSASPQRSSPNHRVELYGPFADGQVDAPQNYRYQNLDGEESGSDSSQYLQSPFGQIDQNDQIDADDDSGYGRYITQRLGGNDALGYWGSADIQSNGRGLSSPLHPQPEELQEALDVVQAENQSLEQQQPQIEYPVNQRKLIPAEGEQLDVCSICLEQPENAVKVRCGHCFCKDCIVTELRRKPKCPNCRADTHTEKFN
ncbi:hypothetical protein MIR68_006301 [Amoeboaphelidium protococcarum]|nr:hypothetical protein MIR68_006301 [Amoeboaphelidium protococcarum]